MNIDLSVISNIYLFAIHKHECVITNERYTMPNFMLACQDFYFVKYIHKFMLLHVL